ncbi:uncharacterized protein CTHT_0064640 [Thermochaetoides thermophila DSM 1495]|uniref:BTB domain-containing protein n=1 Tax=Chaetomium thermophilum (strain DSM 1495 / CBS 144.50 / IMI 039719) TaxID=759272 RepID=G0SG11_CHATD|nr:hypothetical protein CTHT_0064640 [Thermochaetoides thermophila DSM 1495]EGS17150.1 hypothetical protein CTHT_0064640 [Thermochaetoides thermophila DSM 1495]
MLKEELQAVKQWDHKIDLPSTSYQAGHALVNYLYCGSLDCHGHGSNNGPPPQQKLALLLEIYALARTYVLPGLEVLAREELESLAAKFSPFELFDAAKISYPTSVGDDVWFPGFVKVCIKAALQNPSSLQVERNLTDYTNGGSLVKLFLSFANDEAASEASDDAMMQPTPSEVTSTTERSPTSTSQLMVTQQHEAKDDSSPTPVYRDLVNLLERLKKCSTETDPYDKDYLKGNWRWG